MRSMQIMHDFKTDAIHRVITYFQNARFFLVFSDIFGVLESQRLKLGIVELSFSS